jgi:uncharacterized protein YcbK (DUF882 family)
MVDRRKFLSAFVGTMFAAGAPPVWAQAGFPTKRWVNIVFTPTGERFADRYFWDGVYSISAIRQFSWTCRDYRANEWKWIHPWLMDLIFVLHWKYDKNEVHILSGYRSSKTNSSLENPQQFEGAEANHQHERAIALDIQVPDVDNNLVAHDMASVIYGGLGTYPYRDFFHADFGSQRHWTDRSRPRSHSRSRSHAWSGSGFVVNTEGYLVTNAHVANECPSLTISYNGEEIPVTHVLAIDEAADLALLKIEGQWKTTPLFSKGNAEMGDNIFALGFHYAGYWPRHQS